MENSELTNKIKEHPYGEIVLKYQEYISEMYGKTDLHDNRDIYDFLETIKHSTIKDINNLCDCKNGDVTPYQYYCKSCNSIFDNVD